MNKVSLLEAVAQRWTDEAICYAVAHGLEGYPAHVGRDLDVLVETGSARRVIDLAQEVLEAAGLSVVRPPPLWGERVVAADLASQGDLLEVHATEAICWGAARLCSRPEPSQRIGPFQCDPWAAYAKGVLLPFLAGDTAKALRASEPCGRPDLHPDTIRPKLQHLIGSRLSDAVLRALHERAGDALEQLRPQMRRALTRGAWTRRPGAAARRIAAGLWRRVRQPFSPSGLVIHIVGPPGCGKSTVQRAICEGDPLIFTRCRSVSWWSTPRPPRGTWYAHWRRVAWCVARGLWRACLDRIDSSRQRLIVYEGSALDLLAAPARFGLRSPAGGGLPWRVLPRPDLVLLVDAPPLTGSRDSGDAVERRSDEYARWHLLASAIPTAAVVPGRRPVAEIQAQCRRHIVTAFLARYGRTLPPQPRNPAQTCPS